MTALEKYTQKTLKKVQSGGYKDLQEWIDSLSAYRIKALVEGVDKRIMDAMVSVIEIADAFIKKETGIFQTAEEKLASA